MSGNLNGGRPAPAAGPAAQPSVSHAQYACPHCAGRLRVAVADLGKPIRCPHCGGVIQTVAVPMATLYKPSAEPLGFSCPTCATRHTVPAQRAGEKVLCSKCGQKLRVPVPPRPVPQNRTILGTLEPALDDVVILDDPPRRRGSSRDRASCPDRSGADNGTDYGSLALSLGILSMFVCAPVLSPLAIIFGIVALTRRRQPGADVSAIFGIVLGIIGVLIFAFLFLVYFGQEAQRQGMHHF